MFFYDKIVAKGDEEQFFGAMEIFNRLFKKTKENKDISAKGPLHEFCPRCEADLVLQEGYSNGLPYWVCKGCGEMLINPSIQGDSNIVWVCDKCDAMLNIQAGFNEDCGKWTCIECGFVNKIDTGEVYESDAEYKNDLGNPYKGLSEDEIVKLMQYEEIESIGGRLNVILVKDTATNELFVKKVLKEYDVSIYRYLKDNPIAHMPRIEGIYEGDNYLVIVEEYIKGKTVLKLLEAETFDPVRAIYIVRQVVLILKDLHKMKTPIIHRDIKPSNIIIDDSGEVYLIDINVAKWHDKETNEDTKLLGTLHYAAPEQFGYGFNSSSEKTDIYAVGVLLNVLITGKLPKEEKANGVVWNVIEKCISLDAKDRYTDDELLEALESILR